MNLRSHFLRTQMQSSHRDLNTGMDFREDRLQCQLCCAAHLSFESVFTVWGGEGCT